MYLVMNYEIHMMIPVTVMIILLELKMIQNAQNAAKKKPQYMKRAILDVIIIVT